MAGSDATTPGRAHGQTRTDTTVVHGGREDLRELGVHAPPLDRSTTYPIRSLAEGTADLELLGEGGAAPQHTPVYARLYNPTVARWERGIAALEHADAAVAFASGMAAITATLLAAGALGRHVVALRPLYGGTDHLLASGLLGTRTTWATPDTVAASIEDDTALVIVETPGNPTLTLVDIPAIVAQAGAVPVLVDNTFATPILQRPLELGATWALHSATKALGGHGDVIAGVVATDEAHARALRQVRVATGALLDPQAAALLHRSLQTLALRVRAAQANAIELARRLALHPGVERVCHPSLPGCDPDGIVATQMDGPGSMLTFEVAGGYDAAGRVLEAVRLLTPAVSLGSADSLIEHPAGLTHRVVDPEALAATGITPGLLRVSVGIEDVEDLWADLDQAIAAATGRRIRDAVAGTEVARCPGGADDGHAPATGRAEATVHVEPTDDAQVPADGLAPVGSRG
ncbi:MAG: trans-sulfuration enzyme family protein [Nitriliruptoraceae bacterium]